jgi:hypothetical protein
MELVLRLLRLPHADREKLVGVADACLTRGREVSAHRLSVRSAPAFLVLLSGHAGNAIDNRYRHVNLLERRGLILSLADRPRERRMPSDGASAPSQSISPDPLQATARSAGSARRFATMSAECPLRARSDEPESAPIIRSAHCPRTPELRQRAHTGISEPLATPNEAKAGPSRREPRAGGGRSRLRTPRAKRERSATRVGPSVAG